mmetsp:Transcript_24195/g.78849  ORF Transcript_24195/g.78849 Transcript_24195/m.78849 type:complete len:102 (-) Transcript_24195:2545-2850(-)
MSDCMLSHWGLSTPTSGGKQEGRQPTGSTLCDSCIAEALRLSMNEASRTAAERVPATVRGGDPTFPVWKLNRKHKMLFHQWVLGKKTDEELISEVFWRSSC